jgi:formylglycine-generating enzyme required for sulfatase activity
MSIALIASCAYPDLPRLTTCGPTGIEDCSAAAMVPGGTFNRGDDPKAGATVSPFVLDTYEVTVGRFREFIDAGFGTQAKPPASTAGMHPNLPMSGWDSNWNTKLANNTLELIAAVKCASAFETWTDVAGKSEGKPIGCVSWFEAMAFCIWDGGYLPTEAEWNFAASGGDEQRVYPWSTPANSTKIDCAHANYRSSDTPVVYCANNPQGAALHVGEKSPEGDGKWGHADLGGNVSEWVLDYYADAYQMPCTDCANLGLAPDRVRRGGSFNVVASNLRTSYRAHAPAPATPPDDRSANLGMRCARAPR